MAVGLFRRARACLMMGVAHAPDLGGPRPGGVGGDPGEGPPPGRDVDEEQDVEAPAKRGVDCGEVIRRGGLRTDDSTTGPTGYSPCRAPSRSSAWTTASPSTKPWLADTSARRAAGRS